MILIFLIAFSVRLKCGGNKLDCCRADIENTFNIYIYIYGREQGAINVMKVSTINSRGKVKIFKKRGR